MLARHREQLEKHVTRFDDAGLLAPKSADQPKCGAQSRSCEHSQGAELNDELTQLHDAAVWAPCGRAVDGGGPVSAARNQLRSGTEGACRLKPPTGVGTDARLLRNDLPGRAEFANSQSSFALLSRRKGASNLVCCPPLRAQRVSARPVGTQAAGLSSRYRRGPAFRAPDRAASMPSTGSMKDRSNA